MRHSIQIPAPARFTPEEMDHVGPGCFVKVGDGQVTFWAQVKTINGDQLGGSVLEIVERNALSNIAAGSHVRFKHQHIVELGCDYLCFC